MRRSPSHYHRLLKTQTFCLARTLFQIGRFFSQMVPHVSAARPTHHAYMKGAGPFLPATATKMPRTSARRPSPDKRQREETPSDRDTQQQLLDAPQDQNKRPRSDTDAGCPDREGPSPAFRSAVRMLKETQQQHGSDARLEELQRVHEEEIQTMQLNCDQRMSLMQQTLDEAQRECVELRAKMSEWSSVQDCIKDRVKLHMYQFLRPVLKFAMTNPALVPSNPCVECPICKTVPQVGYASENESFMVCGHLLKDLREDQVGKKHIADNGRVSTGCNAIICGECWRRQTSPNVMNFQCPNCRRLGVAPLETLTKRRRCMNCPFTAETSEELTNHVFECPNAPVTLDEFDASTLYAWSEGLDANRVAEMQWVALQIAGIYRKDLQVPPDIQTHTMFSAMAGADALYDRGFEANRTRLHTTIHLIKGMLDDRALKYVHAVLMVLSHCNVMWDRINTLGLVYTAMKFVNPRPWPLQEDSIPPSDLYAEFLQVGHSPTIAHRFVDTFLLMYVQGEQYIFRKAHALGRTAMCFSRYYEMLMDNVTGENPTWDYELRVPEMFKTIMDKLHDDGIEHLDEVQKERVQRVVQFAYADELPLIMHDLHIPEHLVPEQNGVFVVE